MDIRLTTVSTSGTPRAIVTACSASSSDSTHPASSMMPSPTEPISMARSLSTGSLRKASSTRSSSDSSYSSGSTSSSSYSSRSSSSTSVSARPKRPLALLRIRDVSPPNPPRGVAAATPRCRSAITPMIDRPDSAISATRDNMITLTLPDGAMRTVARGTLPSEVVRSIGERLLRDAIAVEVDGQIQDLVTPLRSGGSFRVLTRSDPRSLDVLRHSAAHVLATAVRRLRPEAKIGFGPAIEDGFYYDFEVEKPFTPDDLAAFEEEMRKVAAEKYPFVREEVDRDEALDRFASDP